MTSEQKTTLEDFCYLVDQMLFCEVQEATLRLQVSFLTLNSQPENRRPTLEETRLLRNAVIESFLNSYRNLLEFFRTSEKKPKGHKDSRADDLFSYSGGGWTKDKDKQYEYISKHLSHFSDVRRERRKNEAWDLEGLLDNCQDVLIKFLRHCETDQLSPSTETKALIGGQVNALQERKNRRNQIMQLRSTVPHQGGTAVTVGNPKAQVIPMVTLANPVRPDRDYLLKPPHDPLDPKFWGVDDQTMSDSK